MTQVTHTAKSGYEVWFEYVGSHKERTEKGNRVVTDPDDPRWDTEMTQAPFGGGCHGYVGLYEVMRVSGEVVKKRLVKGFACYANKAREFMRDAQDRISAGSTTPWDTDHTFRDLQAQRDKALREGRDAERNALRESIAELMKNSDPGRAGVKA